jgi:hypothetical protein
MGFAALNPSYVTFSARTNAPESSAGEGRKARMLPRQIRVNLRFDVEICP